MKIKKRTPGRPKKIECLYMTVKDAAAVLGVNQMSLYKWIRDGKFPARKLSFAGQNGIWRVLKSDVYPPGYVEQNKEEQ